MNVGIVVLAAGEAKRFGSAKLVMPIEGVPLVRRAALAALEVGTQVVVVTGAHRDAVEACVADLAVTHAFNADWERGMGCSIACGVAALRDCEAVIIALADQPLIGRDEFAALIMAHVRASGRIVAAKFDDVLGPPCLFPRQYFHALMELHSEQGARGLLMQYTDQVDTVPLPAAAVDIDTRDDYFQINA